MKQKQIAILSVVAVMASLVIGCNLIVQNKDLLQIEPSRRKRKSKNRMKSSWLILKSMKKRLRSL